MANELFSDQMNIIIMNQRTYGIVVWSDDINQTVELLMLIGNPILMVHIESRSIFRCSVELHLNKIWLTSLGTLHDNYSVGVVCHNSTKLQQQFLSLFFTFLVSIAFELFPT